MNKIYLISTIGINIFLIKRETFNHLTTLLEEARQHAHANMTIMLIGNKCNLTHKMTISIKEGEQFAWEYALIFMKASAKIAQNVEQVK